MITIDWIFKAFFSLSYGLLGEAFGLWAAGVQNEISFKFGSVGPVTNELFVENGLDTYYVTFFDRIFPYFCEFKWFFVVMSMILLILNALWKLFKIQLGTVGDTEDKPGEIVARTCIAGILVIFSYTILNAVLNIVDELYVALVDYTNLSDAADFQFLSIYAINNEGKEVFAGLLWLIVSVVCLFIILVNFVGYLMSFFSRYVITALLYYFSPFAMAMAGSKSSSRITKNFFLMFASQLFVTLVNVILMYAICRAMTAGKGIVLDRPWDMLCWTFIILAMIKVASTLDKVINQIGLNAASIPPNLHDAIGLVGGTMQIFKETGKGTSKVVGKGLGIADKASGGKLSDLKNMPSNFLKENISMPKDTANNISYRDNTISKGLDKDSAKIIMGQNTSGFNADETLRMVTDDKNRLNLKGEGFDFGENINTSDLMHLDKDETKGFILNSLDNAFGEQLSGIDKNDVVEAEIGAGGFALDMVDNVQVRGQLGNASDMNPEHELMEGQSFGAIDIGDGYCMSAYGDEESVAKILGSERLEHILSNKYEDVTEIEPGLFNYTEDDGSMSQVGLASLYSVGSSNASMYDIGDKNAPISVVSTNIPDDLYKPAESVYANNSTSTIDKTAFINNFPTFDMNGYSHIEDAQRNDGIWTVVASNSEGNSKIFGVHNSDFYKPKVENITNIINSNGYKHFVTEFKDIDDFKKSSKSLGSYSSRLPKRVYSKDHNQKLADRADAYNRNQK